MNAIEYPVAPPAPGGGRPSGRTRTGRALPGPFAALTPSERRVLRRWAIAARSGGIDGVEDLAARGWPGLIQGAVIGIFRQGRPYADLLAVGQTGAWVVACCADGRISPPSASLADVLALVFPADGLAACG